MVERRTIAARMRTQMQRLSARLRSLENETCEMTKEEVDELVEYAVAISDVIEDQLGLLDRNDEYVRKMRDLHTRMMESVRLSADLRLYMIRQGRRFDTNRDDVLGRAEPVNVHFRSDASSLQEELNELVHQMERSEAADDDRARQHRRRDVWNRLGAPSAVVRSEVRTTGAVLSVTRANSNVRANLNTAKPPLPPFADRCPIRLNRAQGLVGLTEIYVRRPQSVHGMVCPGCNGEHPLFRCQRFLTGSLIDRWYDALDFGVCLNCLQVGHSSFKCHNAGNCRSCRIAHNSVLCPAADRRNMGDRR